MLLRCWQGLHCETQLKSLWLWLLQLYTGALSQAGGRLRDAAMVLPGPEGVGRWRQLHGQLVARRNRLVSQLADAYQVSSWEVNGLGCFIFLCTMFLDDVATGSCMRSKWQGATGRCLSGEQRWFIHLLTLMLCEGWQRV
jgi:hypothetical protein